MSYIVTELYEPRKHGQHPSECFCPVEVYLNWTSEEGLIHVRLGFGFPFVTLFGQGSRPQSDTFLTSK